MSLLCFLQFSLQTRDKKYKEQQKRFSQWYLQGQRDWNSQITKTVIAGQNSALLYCWGHSNSHAEQCAYTTLTMPGPPLASRSGHHSLILGSCEQCHNCNDDYHPRPASASFFSPPACWTCGLPPWSQYGIDLTFRRYQNSLVFSLIYLILRLNVVWIVPRLSWISRLYPLSSVSYPDGKFFSQCGSFPFALCIYAALSTQTSQTGGFQDIQVKEYIHLYTFRENL